MASGDSSGELLYGQKNLPVLKMTRMGSGGVEGTLFIVPDKNWILAAWAWVLDRQGCRCPLRSPGCSRRLPYKGLRLFIFCVFNNNLIVAAAGYLIKCFVL